MGWQLPQLLLIIHTSSLSPSLPTHPHAPRAPLSLSPSLLLLRGHRPSTCVPAPCLPSLRSPRGSTSAPLVGSTAPYRPASGSLTRGLPNTTSTSFKAPTPASTDPPARKAVATSSPLVQRSSSSSRGRGPAPALPLPISLILDSATGEGSPLFPEQADSLAAVVVAGAQESGTCELCMKGLSQLPPQLLRFFRAEGSLLTRLSLKVGEPGGALVCVCVGGGGVCVCGGDTSPGSP